MKRRKEEKEGDRHYLVNRIGEINRTSRPSLLNPSPRPTSYLQSNGFVGGGQQFKDSFDASFPVKGRDHRLGMFRHEGDEELQHVLDVVVFVHRVEEVEHGLQLVVEDAVAFEDQLLHVEQDEGAESQDFVGRGTGTVKTLCFRRGKPCEKT